MVIPMALASLLAAPPSYPELLASIRARRAELAAAHATSARPDTVLVAARAFLLTAIDAQFEAWKGTRWDFNGTTRTPRQGAIACGYFVTTVLQDAGFVLPRIRWAQLAAEPMIRKMAPASKGFRDRPVREVEHWLLGQGDGLYAVGLDNHVGFVRVPDGEALFVHSSYYRPSIGVMAETLHGENPFAHARYRFIGRLLDDRMVVAWLEGRDLGP